MKHQLQRGMINVNYQRDHVLYQIFKIILSIFKKKHGKNTDNLTLRKYVKKVENIITLLELKLEIILTFRRLKQ